MFADVCATTATREGLWLVRCSDTQPSETQDVDVEHSYSDPHVSCVSIALNHSCSLGCFQGVVLKRDEKDL